MVTIYFLHIVFSFAERCPSGSLTGISWAPVLFGNRKEAAIFG